MCMINLRKKFFCFLTKFAVFPSSYFMYYIVQYSNEESGFSNRLKEVQYKIL